MKKLLSPPTTPIFFISVIIAVIAVLAAEGMVSGIPLAPLWIMGIAYALLTIGCLMRRV